MNGGARGNHFTMTNITKIVAYLDKRPIRTGFFAVLATVTIGISIAFATSLTTPAQVYAQVVGPPCCVPPPPSCILSADPSTLPNGGGPTTLSWETTAASDMIIQSSDSEGNSTAVTSGWVSATDFGSQSISLVRSTEYTMTVSGPGGESTCHTNVTVEPPPPAPIAPTCALTASPTSIQSGGSSTLSWSTKDATSFSIDHDIGFVTPVDAGTRSVSPINTTIYTGTATGSGGSVTCTATVTVTETPPVTNAPVCTLVANPPGIQSGNSSTLSWNTTNASSFSIDQNIGSVTPIVSGAISVSPTATTKYTGTVTGSGGTAHCEATVTVTETPPVTNAPVCTLVANPPSIQNGGSSELSWTTTHATSFSIGVYTSAYDYTGEGVVDVADINLLTQVGLGNVSCPASKTCDINNDGSTNIADILTLVKIVRENIGSVTPVNAGSRTVTPTATTKYTGTVTGSGGTAHCEATVTVTETPPVTNAPVCTLTAEPASLDSGEHSTLTWATTNASAFRIDQGIGSLTPVAGGATTTRAITDGTTFTGTATGTSGQTITCTASVSVNSSGGGGGGGGGSRNPRVLLSAIPRVSPGPLANLYLSQIPYTGLDLGPAETIVYWVALIAWSLALAYLVLFGAVPFAGRYARGFGDRVSFALNERERQFRDGYTAPAKPMKQSVQAMPVATHGERRTESPREAPRGYSSFDGFRSFAHNDALSVEDIVKGLTRAPQASLQPMTEPIRDTVEPIFEMVEPISDSAESEMPLESEPKKTDETSTTPADIRGFTMALVEGDRTAVFAGLRQHMRGGGTAESLLSATACLLDDVYRARVEGTSCDPDIARLTARLATPTLEKLVMSLTTAIDSSYSTDVTGAKLALTRALSTLGA